MIYRGEQVMRMASARIKETGTVGMIEAEIELSNPRKPDLQPLAVRAMVDTGAMTICIPEHVVVQLQLPEIEKREVTTADERSHVVPYVGPIQIRFQNRTCFTGALVIGDSVLLGAVPLEDMDLVISPAAGTITVNPRSPNIPSALVKCLPQKSKIDHSS
jgi:clan AA aspartic protease